MMTEIDIDLGAKIRNYRKEKNISINALAEKVSITPSMLSQIERNLANPSINTLKLISSALEIPLFQFFTDDSADVEKLIVRSGERKKFMTSNKDTTYEYELLTPDTTGTIEFIYQVVKAGSNTGDAVQSHDGEEVAYLMKGTLNLMLGEAAFRLDAGDSVRIPARSPHLWINEGKEDAVLIFAITPPCF